MSAVEIGVLLAIALFAALLVPYLYKEIRRGKANLGRRLPLGASEPHPGTRANPAPGHPDGQSDPWQATHRP
ncbi:MAG TPA: hypothetical protein VKI43_01470 [Vicinamibacterales bacterium]|nr:hypothetical protein [Vicinamibacterales bacterium]